MKGGEGESNGIYPYKSTYCITRVKHRTSCRERTFNRVYTSYVMGVPAVR